MKGNPEVIDFLNRALTNELTAINQYFLHARMYDNWGLKELGKLRIGEEPREMLRCDLDLEREAVPLLREATAHCESVGDYVSRELFEDILQSEEAHIDGLETQIELIERVGMQNFLQSQM